MAVQISGNDITVPRDTTVTRNLTVGGVLTYEDVTNVDSVGLVTARTGIEIGARPGVAASISVDGNMIVSGISTFNGDVKLDGGNLVLGDSGGSNDDRIKLGASGDLSIFHDGSNSYVRETGTGSLFLEGNSTIYIGKASGGAENGVVYNVDGSVDLYYDNSKKLSTESDGIKIHAIEGGEAIITFFADEGDDATDKYRIVAQDSNDLVFQRHTGSGFSSELRLKSGGGLQLNYQGTKMIETISDGTSMPDGKFARFGNSNDMNMGHNTYNYITYTGAEFRLTGDSTNNIRLMPKSDESAVVCEPNGAVELYHNGTRRLFTDANGIEVSTNLHVPDAGVIELGTDSDMHVYHNGSDGFIKMNSGGVGNILVDMNTNSTGFFVRTTSNSVANLTLKKNDANGNGIDYLQCRRTDNQLKLAIAGTGDVTNVNNSYGSISDSKLKENIVDANSQWNDIKSLRIRNFNYIDDSDKKKMLGLVAQEVETVSSGLVYETIDRDEKSVDLGTTTKNLRYSVLYMKSVKALQEAMTRIETLESEVTALKSS